MSEDQPRVGVASEHDGEADPPTEGVTSDTVGEPSPAAPGWTPGVPDPAWAAAPGATTQAPTVAQAPTAKQHRGGKSTFLAALVGGVVGALVASGVFLVTKDDKTTTKTITRTVVAGKNSSVIAQPTDIQGILTKVEPGIVSIQIGTKTGLGSSVQETAAGSGFVITADGYVVTNFHVVDGADRVQATFSDGTKRTAQIVGTSRSNDLAVIKVNGSDLPTVVLGDANKLQVGDDVIAIGNALALDGGPTVTKGIVSALHRQADEGNGVVITDLVQTDAAINPGNSGGPLVDSAGEVVGINTLTSDPTQAQNIGFAISISHAKPIIEGLRQAKPQAFLGVATITVTSPIAREQGLNVDHGALVRNVTSGSPADDAGIQEGDVITAIDGSDMKTSEDVQSAVRAHKPGDSVRLEIDRNGSKVNLKVKLASRPADS